MTQEEQKLWARIQDFRIDDPGIALPFPDRLARENNWSPTFAKAVTLEYKKFLFLCVVSNQPVTPSDAVDQAWHLHLTYTHSYWTELCAGIVGRPIQHTPTKGGVVEGNKFRNYYDETLQLYRDKFEELPPRHIWKDPDARFNDDFTRVNKRTHWVIRKPRRPDFIVPVLTGMVSIGLYLFLHANIILWMGMFVLLFTFPNIYFRQHHRDRDDSSGGSCSNTCSSDGGHGHGHSGCSGCSSGCSGCGSGD